MQILNRSPRSTHKKNKKKKPNPPPACFVSGGFHHAFGVFESGRPFLILENPVEKSHYKRPTRNRDKYTKRTFSDMWLMVRKKGHLGLHYSQYTIIIQAACILLNYYWRAGVYRSIYRVVNNLTEFVKRSEETSRAECIPWWCPSTESTSGWNIHQRPFHIL